MVALLPLEALLQIGQRLPRDRQLIAGRRVAYPQPLELVAPQLLLFDLAR